MKPAEMTLLQGDEAVKLEPQVFQLLHLLVANHERVVTKEELNKKIWQGRTVTDAALASRLRTARQAIGDNGSEQRLIKTIPNLGVRFVGQVEVKEAQSIGPIAKIMSFIRQNTMASAGALVVLIGAGVLTWHFGFNLPEQRLQARFTKTPDAAIRFYNHKKLRNASVEDCMRACLETTEFTCRSFDYYKRLDVCDLSAATAESVGGLKTNYELDPYDHYARKEYPPGPIELGRDDTLDPDQFATAPQNRPD